MSATGHSRRYFSERTRRLQAAGILAADFPHVGNVLNRLYVLVFTEHGARRMHLGGVTTNPTGHWTMQQARKLAMNPDERAEDIKFLIRDRGPNFTTSFDAVFQAPGVWILRPQFRPIPVCGGCIRSTYCPIPRAAH
jgi:hypothetical protein